MADSHKTSPDIILIGERAQQLDMLLHVQEFSAMAVLITGPSAIGKTALLEAASAQLSVHHQLVVINGFETNQLTDLIDVISLQLGCEANLVDLDTQLSKMAADNETFHLLIDDAHLLDDQVIQLLLEKSTLAHGWRLILCGDESLKVRLSALQTHFENKLYHLIELQPFTEEESEAFISQLFKGAGIDVLPLSMKDIHQLWLLSKGVPGKLMELVELEQDQQKLRASKFPMGHIAAVGLISAVLIVSILYQEQEVKLESDDAIAMLLQEQAKRLEHTKEIVSQKKDTAQNQLSATELAQDPADANELLNQIISDSEEESAPQVLATNMPGEVIEESRPDESISKRVETAPQAVGKITTHTPKEVVSDSANARPSHPLLQAPSQSYALQLLGVRNEDSAKAFVKRFARQMDGSKLNIYETRFKGEPWFVVVYGPINTKQQASREASALSKTLNGQPWVRPISKIQADIRQIPDR